jgi:hypothetical protein
MENHKEYYEILSWNKAFEMLYENGMEFHRPSKILLIENVVEVYMFYFSSGENLVIPKQPVEGFSRNEYPAFLYNNTNAFETAVRLQQFPVPEKFKTLLEKEKESIKRIDETYPDYLSFFDTVMNTKFSFSISKDRLNVIHPQIFKKRKHPAFRKLILSYSILINRYLIQERSAKNILVAINSGYTPFYAPCVQIGESIVNPYESIGWNELESSFEKCLKRVLFAAKPLLPEFKFDDGLAFMNYMME